MAKAHNLLLPVLHGYFAVYRHIAMSYYLYQPCITSIRALYNQGLQCRWIQTVLFSTKNTHSCKTFVGNEIYLPFYFPLCLYSSPEPPNCESVVTAIFTKGRTNYFSRDYVIYWPVTLVFCKSTQDSNYLVPDQEYWGGVYNFVWVEPPVGI